MTVNEFHRACPEVRDQLGPTFSEWASDQYWSAYAYRHEGRTARFRAALDLIAEGRPDLALWVVPPSNEKRAEELCR